MDNKVRRRKDEHDVLTEFTTLTYFIHTITGTVARLALVGEGELNGECPSTFVLSLVLCHCYNAVTNTICYHLQLIGRRFNHGLTNIQPSTGPSYHKSTSHKSLSCHEDEGDKQQSRAWGCNVVPGSTRGNPGIGCEGARSRGGTEKAKYVK